MAKSIQLHIFLFYLKNKDIYDIIYNKIIKEIFISYIYIDGSYRGNGKENSQGRFCVVIFDDSVI